MNLQIKPYLLAAGLVVCSVWSAQAATPTLGTFQVLPGGTTCDHVIHLMHRHGVNNSVNRVIANSFLHHSPLGSMVVPGAELGDLEVVQVTQVLHNDDACGPRIAVVVRNNSVRSVCNFHVSAVALLGRICPTSPSVTVRVAEIKCGEDLEVILPLPLEALAMGNRNGQIIGFQRLVVAIDSFDELVETNEANNLKAFDRSCLTVVSAVVEETVESVSTETGAAATQVTETQVADTQVTQTSVTQTGAQPPAGGGAATAVGPNAPSSNADELQSAIRIMDVQSETTAATTAP